MQSINDFSIDLFSSFNPQNDDIRQIKELWLQILDMSGSEKI